MAIEGIKGGQYKVLADGEIREIHQATLQVLEEVGVRVEYKPALNFVHLSIGMIEQMLTASYEECVIDNEILGATYRILKGLKVNKDTIAFDVIKEVGPGGNYLMHNHTLKNFRKVRWFPKLTNREKWANWQAKGAKDMRQGANEEATRILKEHHPQYLSQKLCKELDKFAEQAQRKVIREKK